MITTAQWLRVLTGCGVRFARASEWAPIFEKYVQPEAFNLGTREIDDFTGQVLHETRMLDSLEEDLDYSARRLCEVWPHRFPTIGEAAPYAWNPEALANKTYGGRLGNTAPGDGWKYRGGGIPMITGKANYALLEKLLGLPLLEHPEILRTPDGAMRCGLAWWEKKIPDEAIDSVEKVTRVVQGAELGLEDRARLTAKAGFLLKGLA
jgi:putative chitinase